MRSFAADRISLEPQARALTVVERSGLAPRRAHVPVCDFCDEGLTIDSRLPRHCSRSLCVVPGNENKSVWKISQVLNRSQQAENPVRY